ncbi:hypothetical protein M378DRAFT_166280 [Amanita muscaria Koide BX008]|uniref:Uncharacterized protein n=1 Tax=Amanita muscaria (strain Koide BX008) TaxID=946122 RepID=A0A0C2SFV0_AMAMK|nr:hypothetical protein M378DRAFT_166280 [Amanita muscaria Koide BX008]
MLPPSPLRSSIASTKGSCIPTSAKNTNQELTSPLGWIFIGQTLMFHLHCNLVAHVAAQKWMIIDHPSQAFGCQEQGTPAAMKTVHTIWNHYVCWLWP